ncbi:MAG: M56 family metallopeptidase [Oculatellaceae cyanobacterium bins.114]|nr:M56 family metallopeptidase [Oculatellaceae cyanobacterium bins.114]
MHISIMVSAITVAVLVRLIWQPSQGNWANRWHHALSAFLFPPILLLMTSVAVLSMGHHGRMFGLPVGWIGCHIALGFLVWASGLAGYLAWQGWRSLRQIHSYPVQAIAGHAGRVLDVSTLFAAQIGVWQPELVVSQGLLQTLNTEQLEAVLSHEQAHFYYRDNVWFFALGWVRQLTNWLPNTEALWQELLLLRELRADHWATQHVDALVLAESLLLVVQSPLTGLKGAYAAFGEATHPNRLAERINSLISPTPLDDGTYWMTWIWLPLALLPLLTLPLHG